MRSIANRPRLAFVVLTLAGVGGALWEWVDHGSAAGVEPGFIVALTAAAVGAIGWAIFTAVPLAFAAFAAGARHGTSKGGAEPVGAAPTRHLSRVR